MAKGKWRSTLLGIQGLIGHAEAPNWDFLYRASTVRDEKWNIGDRVVTPDGRVFRYGLAVNSIEPGRGVQFTGTIADDGVSGNVNRAQVIGDKELRWASETFTVDELRGGYVIVYGGNNAYQQFGIVGNTACSSSELIVYLDRAITVAVGSTQFTEILPNPYRYLKAEPGSYVSFAGIPMAIVTAAQYFWVQTWGPCWVNPQSGVGGGSAERMVIFGPDGSLRNWSFNSTGDGGYQTAGFIIAKSSQDNDAVSFLMLQISP